MPWIALLETEEGGIILGQSEDKDTWSGYKRKAEKEFGTGIEITWPADARKRYPAEMAEFELDRR